METNVRIEEDWQLPAIDTDLTLFAAFTVVAMASIYLPVISETPIRSILGLAMLLFVPGYALAAVLFPGKKDLNGLERAGLSFGLSIAVTPLIGLALNFTPWAIRIDPVMAVLTIFTLTCCAAANVRRHRLKPADRFAPGLGKVCRSALADMFQGDHGRLDRALSLFLLLCILASAATLAFAFMVPKTGEKFTQFYILGPDGKADCYPTTLRLGESGTVIVGIVNNEYRDVTYDLMVVQNDSSGVSGLFTDRITLADDQTLEKPVMLIPDRAGRSQIEFLLYADGNMETPYRELHLWVNVT